MTAWTKDDDCRFAAVVWGPSPQNKATLRSPGLTAYVFVKGICVEIAELSTT